ncbi:MAG: glycosyltransferase family 2 protein [Eubacteriales bacterium]|nr:glycosyltransferase family 2 protein [Eubacteriales bacterium]
MDSYKISVILPVYNVEKYLSGCLESLVSQDFSGLEIVAVDDGSTDKSPEILRDFQRRHPQKLFIHTTENRGVSCARNYGFSKSRGKYIWFVDSDDQVEPDACRRLYEKAETDGNDLVIFSYYNVDPSTGEKKPFSISTQSQNFQVSQKPCELPLISPYPWIKFIRRSLFQGLAFPPGIRFEDLPVAYLLAAKARSIGVLWEPLYDYRKNVGFLASLTPSTLDIQKSVEYLAESMKDLGLFHTYERELEFITVRHFFFRFWKLLTNYEKDKKELKLAVVNQLWDYLEDHHPHWRQNPYVRYFLPAHLYRMLYFYGSRQELISFVHACDKMEPEEQKAWINAYKASHRPSRQISGPQLLQRESAGREAFLRARQRKGPQGGQVFLLSSEAAGPGSALIFLLKAIWKERPDTAFTLSLKKEDAEGWDAALRQQMPGVHLTLTEPDTPDFGRALALCGLLLADGPLPSYFYKAKGQTLLFLGTESILPLTEADHEGSCADVGLWQHTLLTADLQVFSSPQLREGYLQAAEIPGLCRVPYLILGGGAQSSSQEDIPTREELLSSLGLSPDTQLLLCSQSDSGGDGQRRRDFLAGLCRLDHELSSSQVLLLEEDPQDPVDWSGFRRIRPLPRGCTLYDLLPFCQAFLTDCHPLALALQEGDVPVLRLLPGEEDPHQDAFSQREIPCFHSVPQLGKALSRLPQACGRSGTFGILHTLRTAGLVALDGILPSPLPLSATGPKRVLYYTGRKLGAQAVQEFARYAARFPHVEFWLAYNDLKSPGAKKALKSLPPGSHPLPLRPAGCRRILWKGAGLLTGRLGLGNLCPFDSLLLAGQEEYRQLLGHTLFDQVVITAQDGLRETAALIAASPGVVYVFDSFQPERYQSSRSYRSRLAFLCRMLKDAQLEKLPPQLSQAMNKGKGL